jgi:hypothetical protein
LWITAAVESNFKNYPFKPDKAAGIWQIMPKTIQLLKKAYALKEYSDDDVVTQSEYAACMLIEAFNFYSRYGVPPVVYDVAPKDASPRLLKLLSVRAYYHGGPAIRSADAPILRRRGLSGSTYDDIVSGLKKTLKYYEQATS